MRTWALSILCACGRIGFDDQSASVPQDWWDPSWPYRVPLVVDHTKVAGDLTDFPVLVEIDDAALIAKSGGAYAFIGSGARVLAYELDADAAHPDRLLAWVKVGNLSAQTDSTGYLYYGLPSASGLAPDARNVWTNGYAGVYHFGNGATLDLADSTSVNPGANSGAAAIAGVIGGAADLDGNSNIAVPTTGLDTAAGAVNTVSTWVYFEPTYDRGILAFTDVAQVNVYDLWFETDGCEGFNTGQGEVLGTTAASLSGRWIYLAAVFLNGSPIYAPASAHSNALYIDGVAQALSSCAAGTPASASAYALLLWGSNVHGANYRMVGHLDEGRMSVGARSPQWIATEFANQSAPTAFVAVGPEETY